MDLEPVRDNTDFSRITQQTLVISPTQCLNTDSNNITLFPTTSQKEKDDPDFDTDPQIIEPKSRVLHWASGILTTKDRNRVKRAWTKSLQAEQEGGIDDPIWGHDRRKFGTQMQPGTSLSSLGSRVSGYMDRDIIY